MAAMEDAMKDPLQVSQSVVGGKVSVESINAKEDVSYSGKGSNAGKKELGQISSSGKVSKAGNEGEKATVQVALLGNDGDNSLKANEELAISGKSQTHLSSYSAACLIRDYPLGTLVKHLEGDRRVIKLDGCLEDGNRSLPYGGECKNGSPLDVATGLEGSSSSLENPKVTRVCVPVLNENASTGCGVHPFLPCDGSVLAGVSSPQASPARSWADLEEEENGGEAKEKGTGLLLLEGPELTYGGEALGETSSTPLKHNWASVVKGRVETAMKFSYVKPSSSSSNGGKLKIKPPSTVVQKGVTRWNNTLVGFFLDKMPYSLVQNVAYKLWESKGLEEVLGNGNGFFFFRFTTTDGMNGVFDGGPWYFGGKPVFLKKWQPGLNLSKAGCKNVPIWVHFYNVPLEYWTDEGLSIIASVVGKPLHADKMTESVKRISYARICIEVGVDDDLPGCFDLEMENGDTIEIRIEYNWVPKKCVVCREFGHLTKNCRKVTHQEWTQKNPVVMKDGAKDAAHATKDDGWEEVKRRGKIGQSPPPINVQDGKNPTSSNSNNPFTALSHLDLGEDVVATSCHLASDENVVEEDLAQALVLVPTHVENFMEVGGMEEVGDSFSTPLGNGQKPVHIGTLCDSGQGGLEADFGGENSAFSDCSSVPIDNPLIQKLTMVDEVDRNRKMNRRKKGKLVGSSEASRKVSS